MEWRTSVTVIGDGAVGLLAVLSGNVLDGSIEPGKVFDLTYDLKA